MDTKRSAEFWIEHLKLMKHPDHDNGYFHVPFVDEFNVTSPLGEKRAASSICYSLQKNDGALTDQTMFFRCQSTEMMFYHYGDPLVIYIRTENKQEELEKVVLGPNVDKGQTISYPIPKNKWF